MSTAILIGAMGKSAQIGFHVWLADAMEGEYYYDYDYYYYIFVWFYIFNGLALFWV
jgi:hypothetical protein